MGVIKDNWDKLTEGLATVLYREGSVANQRGWFYDTTSINSKVPSSVNTRAIIITTAGKFKTLDLNNVTFVMEDPE